MNYENIYGNATELEDAEEFLPAAERYFSLAISELFEENFDFGTEYRVAMGHTLRAVSCAQREQGKAVSEAIFNFYLSLNNSHRISCDDSALKGLLYEWRGDAKLMMGKQGCRKDYRTARKQYSKLEFDDMWPWGLTEEFDESIFAMNSYLAHSGIELLPDSQIQTDFGYRIAKKLEAAESLE